MLPTRNIAMAPVLLSGIFRQIVFILFSLKNLFTPLLFAFSLHSLIKMSSSNTFIFEQLRIVPHVCCFSYCCHGDAVNQLRILKQIGGLSKKLPLKYFNSPRTIHPFSSLLNKTLQIKSPLTIQPSLRLVVPIQCFVSYHLLLGWSINWTKSN